MCGIQVVSNGGLFAYESILQLCEKSELHEEKNRLIRSLGSASDSKLLQRTLEYSMSEHVRTQDAPTLIVATAANARGTHLVTYII